MTAVASAVPTRLPATDEPPSRWTLGPVAARPYAWPYDESVDTVHVALICIDWQVDFCGTGGYVDRMGYDIGLTRAGLPATARLLEHARGTGMTVVHTREGHAPDLGDLPANKRWRSAQIGAEIGSVGPAWTDPRARRTRVGDRARGRAGRRRGSSSTSPARARSTPRTSTCVLRTHTITHLLLTGITTDVCVHTTMREANDRGYECLILSDCTGATDPGNHAAALHMVTMQGGVFGAVAQADAVIAATHRTEA